MKKLWGMFAAVSLASVLALGACGDDDGDGGGEDDTPITVDAAPNVPDATTTACGSDACDLHIQICVNDINNNNSCESIPIGCDTSRQCATCGDVCPDGTTCFDLDDDNTVACH